MDKSKIIIIGLQTRLLDILRKCTKVKQTEGVLAIRLEALDMLVQTCSMLLQLDDKIS